MAILVSSICLPCFSPLLFVKKLYFEIIIDSQEVAKLVHSPVYPLPSFPSGDKFYKALVRHQNQEIDLGTLLLTKLPDLFTLCHSFNLKFICVCVYGSLQFSPIY